MDFRFTSFGSVWKVQAVSPEAKAFAEERFSVEGWQGRPTNFNTDHRPARELAYRLIDEGWQVLVD
jgi:hypothetical protein